MMRQKDTESFFRMAMCRMQLALDEIQRLSRETYSDDNMDEAEGYLADAIASFRIAQYSAADQFGYQVRESMGT